MKLPEKIVPDEEWKPVNPNFVKNIVEDTYLVSNYGRIYNKKENRLLTPAISGNHLRVHIRVNENGKSKDTTRSLQRVMMTAFYPVENFENLEVDHVDNCSFNNQLSNLQWLSKEENRQKEINFKHGRSKCTKEKESKYNDIYSDDNIRKVCEMLESNISYREISNITGISVDTIKNIKNKNTFLHVSRNYNFYNR